MLAWWFSLISNPKKLGISEIEVLKSLDLTKADLITKIKVS